MVKINVTSGVYMLSAPEVNMNVLCAAPMDIVKLMLRKGLIQEVEKNGIVYESGPNAILLSDVASQNGLLCNMIEFPVLQMHYKQGMILPKHPNNDGSKPIIIGLKEQVEAQCNYFIRGKYGLVSVRELMESGLSQEQAIEIMRYKMRFNFGKMGKIEDILDLRYIVHGNSALEIKNGLFLKRKGFNVYEFRLGDQELTVDMNLFAEETYEVPYTLNYHKPSFNYFSITHLGEGNGWDPNRPGMSSLICYQGKYFLIDAPPGVHDLLTLAGISVNELEGVFHTHSHDDHFAGLTSLIRTDHRLNYYATAPVRHSVMKKLSAVLNVDESMFCRVFKFFDLEFDLWNNIDGLEVLPCLSPHPVENSILYFRTLWEDDYKIYGHLADTCSERIAQSFLTENEKEFGISLELYHKVQKNYLRPADLKKIDVGGGLIHGDAIDFATDKSRKIILSHNNTDLSPQEKEIGTSVSFASVDIIIKAREDLYIKRTFEYLQAAYPNISQHYSTLLLNSEISHLNVGSVIIKRNEKFSYVYLLISGIVEGINIDINISSEISVGTFIGSINVLMDEPSNLTYRAASYISLLAIKKNIYSHFIKMNKMNEELIELNKMITYLSSLAIFKSNMTNSTLLNIAKNIQVYEAESGELIDTREKPGIYIVKTGAVGIFVEGEMLDLQIVGGVFGEESIIPNAKISFKHEIVQKSVLYVISAKSIENIPAVQWLILESLETKMGRINNFEKEA